MNCRPGQKFDIIIICAALADYIPKKTKGKIPSGKNSIKVIWGMDFKINVYLNNTLVQTYNHCEEVDGLCVG